MRKHVKQEILQLIDSLCQAHREIEDIVKKGQIDNARSMLGECQEYAINLGNIIEQIEGEGCVTISYLEKYCEVLFRVHESLQTDSNVSKVMKKLDNALANIENSVKHDILVRKEVVFFPYKASMWDSLESVYLAAKEDPDCDAYCVPIPYFERNADGSLGQMHYEGGEYPKNIEVIDWKKYNLADRKPDTIYIHNPYDDWNRVTCVHPDYFSNKLKQFTDELVYIPYFVLQEIDPGNQAVIDSMKHFCFQPGIINADKVILQSENMKQIYVAEYRKAAKMQGLTGVHIDKEALDKKFLGIGSPKFDKVLRTKKEDLEIPQEWLKIIEKPDRSWKKIIFYNTSIGALLEHNEKMLVKMESVFEIFKERQGEVALLWRPHPLIPSTIKSMRPWLWVKYQELVKKYKAEGWGIYDDTADMDRAVVLSDAYYGDSSSVVEVCQKAGIPVMVQDVTIDNYSDKRNIMIEDAVLVDNRVWFYSPKLNYLFAMNILTREVEFCEEVPYVLENVERLFAAIKLVGKKLYLIPFYAKQIVVFDIESKEFGFIELEDKSFELKSDGPFFMAVEVYDKYLYIFPVFSKVIICLNTENNEIEYITEWVQQVEACVWDKNDGYFRRQVFMKGNKMFVPFCNANAVIELDCTTRESVIHRLGYAQMGYSGICFDGQDFWLSTRRGGEIVKWNLSTSKVDAIENHNPDMKKLLYAYTGILYDKGRVYSFPSMSSNKLIPFSEEHVIITEGQYSLVKEEDDTLYFYEKVTGVLSIINRKNDDKFEIKIEVDDNYIEDFALINKGKRCVIESNELNLKKMINEFIK